MNNTLSIKSVRAAALEKGKQLTYNRSTGLYQIAGALVASEGEIPSRDEKGKLCLKQSQLLKLISYI